MKFVRSSVIGILLAVLFGLVAVVPVLAAGEPETFEETLDIAKRIPRTCLGTFRFDIRTNEWEMVQ